MHAWNAFKSDETWAPPVADHIVYGRVKPSRSRSGSSSRFTSSIFTRIAIDVAMTKFNHVKINKKNEDRKILDSGINYCLTVEANTDQSAVAFLYDLAYSLIDEGVVAVVPVDTSFNPKTTGGYDILTMRVGQIIGRTNNSVQVHLYNDRNGQYSNIWLPKRQVAIIESPLYPIVNEPNSTLQRLLRKMAIIDQNDNAYATNRLDLILQMPQVIRTDRQMRDAEARIKNIDAQLTYGNNGIAYIDSAEHITQLNRPANSQLRETVEALKKEFYNQLGLTQAIFDGTASEAQLRSYYNRTIDPILQFIIKELERKFLTKTARTQGQAIEAYRNMLSLVSAEQLVSLGDTLRRNEIATSNEIRDIIGLKRSNEAIADQLRNPNISEKTKMPSANKAEGEHTRDNQNGGEDGEHL